MNSGKKKPDNHGNLISRSMRISCPGGELQWDGKKRLPLFREKAMPYDRARPSQAFPQGRACPCKQGTPKLSYRERACLASQGGWGGAQSSLSQCPLVWPSLAHCSSGHPPSSPSLGVCQPVGDQSRCMFIPDTCTGESECTELKRGK